MWKDEGQFNIRVKSQDIHGFESGWSNPHSISIALGDNEPPSTPIIIGPKNGRINVDHEYFFKATDPNFDDIYYHIDWGDSTKVIGPIPHGEAITPTHKWTKEGVYIIKAKSIDEHGA